MGICTSSYSTLNPKDLNNPKPQANQSAPSTTQNRHLNSPLNHACKTKKTVKNQATETKNTAFKKAQTSRADAARPPPIKLYEKFEMCQQVKRQSSVVRGTRSRSSLLPIIKPLRLESQSRSPVRTRTTSFALSPSVSKHFRNYRESCL